MKYYFETPTAAAASYLGDYIAEAGYAMGAPIQPDIVFVADTDKHMVYKHLGEVDHDKLYSLSTTQEAATFFDIMEGKVMLRYNNDKIPFSYIDFAVWLDAFDYYSTTFNKLDKYVDDGKVKMLLEKMLKIGSQLCTRPYKNLHERVWRLAVLSYKASAVYKGYLALPTHIEMEAFEELAKVMAFGADKYERNNWMKPPVNKCQLIDSMMRHIQALLNNEENDSESGLHHIGHIMANVMFIHYHFMEREFENGGYFSQGTSDELSGGRSPGDIQG